MYSWTQRDRWIVVGALRKYGLISHRLWIYVRQLSLLTSSGTNVVILGRIKYINNIKNNIPYVNVKYLERTIQT